MTVEEYHAAIDAQMTETEHQIRLFEELELLVPRYPELIDCFHIANGELRAKTTAARLRKMGVKPGIPDIFLPVPKHPYAGLWIELKSLRKGAKLSQDQENMISRLRSRGYKAEVCKGWRAALKTITDYLDIRK